MAGECAGGARYVVHWDGSRRGRAIVTRGRQIVATMARRPGAPGAWHMTTMFEPGLSPDERARVYAALLDELDARDDR